MAEVRRKVPESRAFTSPAPTKRTRNRRGPSVPTISRATTLRRSPPGRSRRAGNPSYDVSASRTARPLLGRWGRITGRFGPRSPEAATFCGARAHRSSARSCRSSHPAPESEPPELAGGAASELAALKGAPWLTFAWARSSPRTRTRRPATTRSRWASESVSPSPPHLRSGWPADARCRELARAPNRMWLPSKRAVALLDPLRKGQTVSAGPAMVRASRRPCGSRILLARQCHGPRRSSGWSRARSHGGGRERLQPRRLPRTPR